MQVQVLPGSPDLPASAGQNGCAPPPASAALLKYAGACGEHWANPRTNPVHDAQAGSPPVPIHDEAPEALAGATGANVHWEDEQAEDTPKGSLTATALSRAIYSIPAEARVPILERILGWFEPAWPIPAFGRNLTDAREWAAWASLSQREALTLACFETLPAARQAAFLAHVAPERRAAA